VEFEKPIAVEDYIMEVSARERAHKEPDKEIQKKSAGGTVKLEESSKLAVHTEMPYTRPWPYTVEVLAMKSAVKKRRQDQAKRGHKEDDWKSVMGKDPMSRKGRHKFKERRKQKQKRRIQARRRDRQEMKSKQRRKRRVKDRKRDRQRMNRKRERQKRNRKRDRQKMKQKRRRVSVMWTNKQEKKGIREKETAVPNQGRADSEKRQM